jgi:hypothetical protein
MDVDTSGLMIVIVVAAASVSNPAGAQESFMLCSPAW